MADLRLQVLDAMRGEGYTGRLIGVDYCADAIAACKGKAERGRGRGGEKRKSSAKKMKTPLEPIEFVTAVFILGSML